MIDKHFNINSEEEITDEIQDNLDNKNTMLGSLSEESQHVVLSGKDGDTISLISQDVTIIPSSSYNFSNERKMKIHNIVDFGWETKFYVGKLISVHLSGTYLAYALKGRRIREGIIRVINPKTGSHSTIKARRQVKDLAFAHKTDQVILAFVDNVGSLFVYEILEDDGKLVCNSILQVNRKAENQVCENNRVIWCPYIPEESLDSADQTEEGSDISKLLVVIHEAEAHMWNIDLVIKEYGKGTLSSDDVKVGYQTILTGHSMPIRDAAFSPDGYALAIASTNGEVQFFEVFSEEDTVSPRCLHQWKPHDGKPLSSLFFLDDHKNPKPTVQFWRFALTGADNNQEIKLWSCEKWVCLQTIRFILPSDGNTQFRLKAELDLSSKYFLLSDISRKVLHVFEIEEEITKNIIKISSITEYFLDQPILSFVIADVLKYKGIFNNNSNKIIQDKYNDFNVCLKLVWINAKSLQECHIFLKQDSEMDHTDTFSSIFQDAFVYCDKLSDLGSDISSPDLIVQNSMQTNNVSSVLPHSVALSSPKSNSISSHCASSPKVNYKVEDVLLTPEDFISSSPTSVNKIAPCVSSPSSCVPVASWEDLDIKSPSSGRDENSVNSITSLDTSYKQHSKENQKLPIDSPIKDNNILNKNICSMELKEDSEENKFINSKNNDVNIKNETEKISTSFMNNLNSYVPSESMKQCKNSTISKLQTLQSTLDKLTETLPKVMDLMKSQQNSICKVKHKLLSHQKQMKSLPSLQDHIKHMDKIICNNVEKIVSKQIDFEINNLDSFVVENIEDEEWIDKQTTTLSEIVNTSVGHKIEKSVKNEIKTSILPYISNFLETLQHQLQQDLNQKLTTTEYSVKESIGKLIRNKGFSENIGYCMVSAIEPQLHDACLEVSKNMITPSLEKACQNLFQQLNDNFNKGIHEYLHEVDVYLNKQSQQACNKNEKTLTQTLEQASEIKLFTEQLLESCVVEVKKQTDKHLQEMLAKQQETMLTKVQVMVREEIDSNLKEQSVLEGDLSSLRQCSTTPFPPMMDLQMQQQQILQAIKQGQLSVAFQQALSAANLNLVLFTCRAVDPSVVFGQYPCPLQQHVLLSLIQQLVADLSTHIDLKLRYVEEAVMQLDMNNHVTREHGKAVLRSLQQKLMAFLQANTNHKYYVKVKMLLLATHSLCNK
ncbi:enhancer of mRNA-decapping protein 4-like isoform X2 [Centruroides vittatus]|uniref:enhancer of mRNA-decapping protein 4-like isoform X2 n=1 Tax=Centruroides vittatus TaxID=120091 RepID=UPI00350ECC69